MHINQLSSEQNDSLFNADYITDKNGHVKSVVLDYATYKRIEKILLDYGLGKAMEEAMNGDEVDMEKAKTICDLKK